MKLIDCLNSSRSVLQRNKQAQANKSDSKKLEQKLSSVEKSLFDLQNMILIANQAKKTIPECSMTSDHVGLLASAISEINQGVEDRALSDDSILALSSIRNEIKAMLQEKWLSSTKQKAADMTNILITIKDFTDDPKQTEAIATILKLRQTSFPANLDQVIQYQKALENGKTILSETNLTDSVRVFIKKVIEKSAFLDDLNDEVWQWLREHHLINRIALSISTTPNN